LLEEEPILLIFEKKRKMLEKADLWLYNRLVDMGLSDSLSAFIRDSIELVIVLLLAWISYFVVKRILINVFSHLVRKTKTQWDDIVLERKVLNKISYMAPAYIVYLLIPVALSESPQFADGLQVIVSVYMLFVLILILNSFLNAVLDIYEQYEISKSKPIKGYVQVVKIVLYAIIGIIMLASLLGKSPIHLFTGLGALSAVLMLIFKDSILGFVGGIQLSANDMVRKNDWISMPKYGADGVVLDISLTTVKVQNWDKTISTIPTYSLISDSFQNWRGMEESGGRRIKRSIRIDMESVKFCTNEMLERFSKFQNVSAYVNDTEKLISEFNTKNNIDNTVLVNGRRQTNLGIFRAYLKGYLRNHPQIKQDMTFLVRQLHPTEQGLPMEIYVFSKVQEWAKYEDIQSDIFDHVLAVIPYFDLRVFQNPTGMDMKAFVKSSHDKGNMPKQ